MREKYTVASNIFYALKNIWKWDRTFYIFFIPSILMTVFLPLVAAYFPKILIDAVESNQSVQKIIFIICTYFGMLLIINLLNRFCDSRLTMRQYDLSILYQHAIEEKHMRTDYANTDNPEMLTKFQHAYNDACSGQCAPEFIWRSLLALFISVLGLFTYGLEAVLIGLFSVATSSYVINMILTFGAQSCKSVQIISDQYVQIMGRVHDELDRGSTLLDATGGYTGEKRKVLLVVIDNKQYNRLIRLINEVDPKAFVITTDTKSVHGEGFSLEFKV